MRRSLLGHFSQRFQGSGLRVSQVIDGFMLGRAISNPGSIVVTTQVYKYEDTYAA